MNRRYTVPLAVLLAVALSGCKTSETTAMTATSQIILTPTPSIPDAQTSVHKYKVTADVGALVVDAPIGNITITGRNRPGIEVIADATYSSTPPDITRNVSGGTLTVGYTCPTQIPCRVTFVIGVPTGIAVSAATSTGSIWLNNLADAATATTGAGYIYASGLTAQTASFSTDAGGIDAAFTSPPADVTANTMFGTIEIQVPTTATYRMVTNAVAGRVIVTVPQGSAATRTITASTNLGSVEITPSEAVIPG
jgi:hypothetical protein